MQYLIVTESNPRALTTTVNEFLTQGWQPLGAPLHTVEGDYRWSQALVKGMEIQVRGPRWEGGPR